MAEPDIDRFLLRSQKKGVYKLIEKVGLKPETFVWRVFD